MCGGRLNGAESRPNTDSTLCWLAVLNVSWSLALLFETSHQPGERLTLDNLTLDTRHYPTSCTRPYRTVLSVPWVLLADTGVLAGSSTPHLLHSIHAHPDVLPILLPHSQPIAPEPGQAYRDRPPNHVWHLAIFERLDCIISLLSPSPLPASLLPSVPPTTHHLSINLNLSLNLNLNLDLRPKPARHRPPPHSTPRKPAVGLLVGMPSPSALELWNIPFVLAPKIGSCRGRRPTPSEPWARTNATL